jgi:uncharacterized protein YndB with AHSA1/START domain
MNEKKKRIEHKGRIVQKQMRTRATPEQVWDSWADPGKLPQWFTDGAEGEAKVGSTLTWIFEKFGYRFPYDVLEARSAERLVLSGAPPGRPPFLLEVNIGHEGGETVLTLVQSGFSDGAEWDDEYQGIDSGWQMALAVLKHYLENYLGRQRRHAVAMLPAQFSFQRLGPFYREEESLAQWLTRAGRLGKPGERFELTLANGDTMSGEVLADTGREVQLSWEEIEGAVALKAFSMGPQRMLAVDVSTWGGDADDRLEAIEQVMAGSLERLKTELEA